MNRHAMDHPSFLPIVARKCLSRLALALALTLPLGACGGETPTSEAPLAGAQLGGDFTLVDQAGKTVRAADFAGKYTVFYFGYTYCPDVCPLDTANLMQGYHAFAKAHPDQGARLVPVFVSIDPARDTPQVLAQFTGNFGKELVGLTGTPEQIAAVAKEFAVYYEKRAAPKGSPPQAYLMDHSRAAYLMGPDGKPIALLPVEQNGAAVAAELARWVH
ncbi:protein SCO1/2 [Novosphingobium sp. SG720]|nr:protein SCO1/2 [Novosphingobium sp. SG720]